MAREHHCPNCGPQACSAFTSKIHTCGVCAAVWEEVLTDAPAAPAAPKPAPAPTAPAKPASPAAPGPAVTPTPPAKPAAPPAPAASPAAKPVPPPPVPAQPPAPPAAPAPKPVPPASPAKPAVAPISPPTVRGEDKPDARSKRLADVLAAAKVPRCPLCKSDSLAAPSDYAEQGGRVVLQDSQSYRGHRWFADTGEVLQAPPAPKPAAAPATSPAKTAA